MGVTVACTTPAAPPTPDVVAGAVASLPSKAAVEDTVAGIVRARLAHPQGPASISVMIIRGGETLVQRAWGMADAAARRPATAAMTYRIGSISKQFTAALILKLVDSGKLSLDSTLGRHFTGLPGEWQSITIEQLLNHTAGLQRDYRDNLQVALDQLLQGPSAERLIASAARDPLVFTPGSRHTYSNTGYMVLVGLVEKMHGKPYRDVIGDEIARPLGLTTLGWCSTSRKRPTDTIGHVRSPQGELQPAAEVGDLALGGGLCSTAGDLGRWNLALHGGQVLSRASYTAMVTPRGAAVSEHYGFGIRVLRSPYDTPILTHDGNTITFVAENTWYPTEALSVTVLHNSPLGPGTSPAAAHFANIALGKVPAVDGQARRAPEAFVGFYEGRPGRGFTVSLENGTLYAEPTDNTRQRLVLQSGTTYAIGSTGSTMTFMLSAEGRPTSVVFRGGAREQVFAKVR